MSPVPFMIQLRTLTGPRRLARGAAVADVDDPSKVVAGAVVFAITLSVVLLPLAAAALAPEASGRALDRLGEWTQSHQRAINVALPFGFGLYLLVKGVLAL